MSDVVDQAADIEADRIAVGIARAAAPIAVGVPGECDQCEWWMPRLVAGLCPFCRDARRRPPDWDPPVPRDLTATSSTAVTLDPKEKPMPAKSVQIPATFPGAIAAVEALAKVRGIPLGQAVGELIDRGAAADTAVPVEVTAPLMPLPLDALLDLISVRFEERPDQSAALAAAIARAEAAEAKLDQLKALIA